MDTSCGLGTFLVEIYERLAELKLERPFSEIGHMPSDVSKQTLK